MNEFLWRVTAGRAEDQVSRPEGCENEQECGPPGESPGDGHGSRGGACGAAGGSGHHAEEEASLQPPRGRGQPHRRSLDGETPPPHENSPTALRRSWGNVQGPGAENTTAGGTQTAPMRI